MDYIDRIGRQARVWMVRNICNYIYDTNITKWVLGGIIIESGIEK